MNAKTIRTTVALGTVALLGSLAAGTALANKDKGKVKPDPRLPAAVQQMYCLVGDWKGTATLEMGEVKDKVAVSISCKPASGGHAVLCSTRMAGKGFVAEETDLFGYDAGRNQYHWFSVTNQGETHDHVAEVPTGPTVDFVYSGRADGQAMQELIGLTFAEDGASLGFTTTVVSGGVPAIRLGGTLLRK